MAFLLFPDTKYYVCWDLQVRKEQLHLRFNIIVDNDVKMQVPIASAAMVAPSHNLNQFWRMGK